MRFCYNFSIFGFIGSIKHVKTFLYLPIIHAKRWIYCSRIVFLDWVNTCLNFFFDESVSLGSSPFITSYVEVSISVGYEYNLRRLVMFRMVERKGLGYLASSLS